MSRDIYAFKIYTLSGQSLHNCPAHICCTLETEARVDAGKKQMFTSYFCIAT